MKTNSDIPLPTRRAFGQTIDGNTRKYPDTVTVGRKSMTKRHPALVGHQIAFDDNLQNQPAPSRAAPAMIQRNAPNLITQEASGMIMKSTSPVQAEHDQMVIIEVIRPAHSGGPALPSAWEAKTSVQSAESYANAGYEYTTGVSAKSDRSQVSIGRTIAVKEKMIFCGPPQADKKPFNLKDVNAKIQIQAPTPLARIGRANNQALRGTTCSQPPMLPTDITLERNANDMVDQWLENQRGQLPVAPRSAPASDAPRSPVASIGEPDLHVSDSTKSVSIESVYDFDVKGVGTSKILDKFASDNSGNSVNNCQVTNVGAARAFKQRPTPGTLIHDGRAGEGPGLVC